MTSARLTSADWADAIADTDGRQMVVAGPGTGKTEFLVRRVAHLLRHGLARPDEIVVLSFSRRAASRLRTRIEDRAGVTGVPVDVTTFHSLALRLLEASDSGARPEPLTTPEQVAVVRRLLSTEEPAEWPLTYRGVLDSPAFSAEVADFLLRCSERLLTPVDLARMATERADWRGLPGLYKRYLDRLEAIDRTDYGVLLTRAVAALEKGEPTRHRFVLVDEYQDTTPAQARMAEVLASQGNLTVAGDPYQSIFSFRGAEVRNIAAFSAQPGTKRYVLGESFRVPAEIMEAALRVVSSGELPGSAGPVDPAPHRGRCETYVFDQETAEAEWIAREVDHLIRAEGVEPSAIAVLVRSKKHLLSELSRALDRRRVPHDPPDTRLVDHPAVQAVHDLVVVAANEAPTHQPTPTETAASDRAMRRLLLGPLFGSSVGEERALLRARRRSGRRWGQVIERELPSRPGLVGLLGDPTWASGMSCAEGFWELWTNLDGIEAMVTDPHRSGWRRAFTAFAQMVARQTERDATVTLQRLFEMVEDDDYEATPLISHHLSENRVHLTTLHQAKGLEFDAVFIANAVEGVFPDLRRSRRMLRPELLSPERTSDAEAQQVFQVQEEMRLAYTAMTRARRRVVWTATEAGVDQGEKRPSRFLFAAAGQSTPRPPEESHREPVTVSEAETRLRRTLMDPGSPPAARLAAAKMLGSNAYPWWDATTFAGTPKPGADRPVIEGQFRLSPSQAESYRRCPRRYVLERRLRIGDASSVYARFGEMLHDVLERSEAEVIGTGKSHAGLDRALDILDEVWENADFGTPELTRAWKQQGVEALTKLYENWPGKGVPVGVEVSVEAQIAGVTWLGRIDRLEKTEDGLRVVDYKTGRTAMRADDAAESIQLAFYARAIEEAQGEVVASELWYPRTRTNKVTTRPFAMHRLDDVVSLMAEITQSIKAEDWTPRISADCTRCGVRRLCPAWPEGRGAFLP